MTDSHDNTKGESRDARLSDEMIDSMWNSACLHVSGEASAEDEAMLRSADPKLVRDAQLLWDTSGVVAALMSQPKWDVDAAWKREFAQLGAGANAGGSTALNGPKPARALRLANAGERHGRRSSVWKIIAAAAVLVVAIGVGRVLIQDRSVPKSPRVTVPAERVFATRRAERADIRLLDGTRVILNVDSRLYVPTTYGQGARVVRLEGEAFFEVTHDSTRPFSVITKAGVAEDLGTAFVVSSYAEDRGMSVSVVSGEVALRRDSATARIARLKGGQAARMDGGEVTSRQAINVKNELAWTTGRLVFYRTPLKEALPRMSRWFDVDIRLGDNALASEMMSASFQNQSIANVLEVLSAAFNARIEREENAYVLYPTQRVR